MAIVGIGVDLASISRIGDSIERYGERFTRRIYHPDEIEFSKKRKKNIEFLAACFAVKEAALKAISDFPGRGVDWSEIYVTHEKTGKPVLHFEGVALQLCREKGVARSHVSISHDGDMAVAYVILED
ncbi:MAG: holo-ACP synthase [Candidatus Omnitrophica bacterium]|nr:holo-ACP synthase [Candidatus Omnitrophota bacterium]